MVAQTAYTINQGEALAGLLYALDPKEIASRSVETVAGVEFGFVVSRGTDKDKQVVLGGSDYLGITVRELTREGAVNTGVVIYKENETAAVLRSGQIWAICPDGCVPGDVVNYVTATGVLGAGAAGAGELAIPNATWDSVASAGALAILRIGV